MNKVWRWLVYCNRTNAADRARIWIMRLWMIAMIGALALVTWWAYIDKAPALVIDWERPIGATRLRAGEILHLERRVCSYRPITTAHIERRLVDESVSITLPAIEVTVGHGCETRRAMLLVPNVPAGSYRYAAFAHVRVNPLRQDRVYMGAIDIEVIP